MFEVRFILLYKFQGISFREIGKGWILKRIYNMNNGAETPKDVLHFMLEFASKTVVATKRLVIPECCHCIVCSHLLQ